MVFGVANTPPPLARPKLPERWYHCLQAYIGIRQLQGIYLPPPLHSKLRSAALACRAGRQFVVDVDVVLPAGAGAVWPVVERWPHR